MTYDPTFKYVFNPFKPNVISHYYMYRLDSRFPFKGLLAGIFHFYSILENSVSNKWRCQSDVFVFAAYFYRKSKYVYNRNGSFRSLQRYTRRHPSEQNRTLLKTIHLRQRAGGVRDLRMQNMQKIDIIISQL